MVYPVATRTIPHWFKETFDDCSRLLFCADDGSVIDEALQWFFSLETGSGSWADRPGPSSMRHQHQCANGHKYIEYHAHEHGHDGGEGHDGRCPVRGCPCGQSSDGADTGAHVIGTVDPDCAVNVDRLGDLVVSDANMLASWDVWAIFPKPSTSESSIEAPYLHTAKLILCPRKP